MLCGDSRKALHIAKKCFMFCGDSRKMLHSSTSG